MFRYSWCFRNSVKKWSQTGRTLLECLSLIFSNYCKKEKKSNNFKLSIIFKIEESKINKIEELTSLSSHKREEKTVKLLSMSVNAIMLQLNGHRWTYAVSRFIDGGFKLWMSTKNLWMEKYLIPTFLSTLKSYGYVILLFRKYVVWFRKKFIRKKF